MTTATAGNVSGQAGDKDHSKEKLEKRRALGRGLASLLPGPRAVAPAAPASGAPDPIHTAPAHAPVDQRIKGDIRAVVDESVEGSSAGAAGQPGAAVSTLSPASLSAASSFHTSSSPSSLPASVSRRAYRVDGAGGVANPGESCYQSRDN
jgi:hypothetical protein